MQIECGSLQGKTFYQENRINPDSTASWKNDGLPSATLHEFNMNTRQVEYRLKEASGRWRYSTDKGGQTALLSANNTSDISHITYYANGSEVEIFQLTNLNGQKPKILFTAVKNSAPFTLARIFTGECKPAVFYER